MKEISGIKKQLGTGGSSYETIGVYLTGGPVDAVCWLRGGGSIHECLNAVTEMQGYTQNAPEHQRYQAQGGMDSFCFVEECINMMHQHIDEPLLVTLIDRIEEHCPCLQDLLPSVPLGDYNKLREMCEGYKKRQYRFES